MTPESDVSTPRGINLQHWIQDAAGAEAWAFATIVNMNPDIPFTITDCLNIVDTMAKGKAQALAATSPLARTWAHLFTAMDGADCSREALKRIKWMPAHSSTSAIGTAVSSDGTPITAVNWRANRLVDKLAKLAADELRVPKEILDYIDTAAETDSTWHSLAPSHMLPTTTNSPQCWQMEPRLTPS